MPDASKLLSRDEQERIVESIRRAESNTSAEIRVHVENRCKGPVLDRAVAVFDRLGMNRTDERNGVLIYLAVKDRQTAVIGDVAVNRRVRSDFWEQCYAAMRSCFSKGDFAGGLCAAIGALEAELGGCFPHRGADDVNELPDDISFGA